MRAGYGIPGTCEMRYGCGVRDTYGIPVGVGRCMGVGHGMCAWDEGYGMHGKACGMDVGYGIRGVTMGSGCGVMVSLSVVCGIVMPGCGMLYDAYQTPIRIPGICYRRVAFHTRYHRTADWLTVAMQRYMRHKPQDAAAACYQR